MRSNAAAENTQHLQGPSSLGHLLRRVPFALATLACILSLAAPTAAAAPVFGPLGTEAGQIKSSQGMAIDRESGALYVGDPYNNRMDEFGQDGSFIRAWGWGVRDGASEFETCTSETNCLEGVGGGGSSGAGQFASTCGATGVAVDNDPLSASYNDVYVVDWCNHRVQKFDASGKFILMFGGDVNKNGTNVCAAGEECQAGVTGEADAQFEWRYNEAFIAVGPAGTVYVGDKARVQIFEPTGAWKENISLSSLSSEGKVTALAVNPAGDVFLKDEGVPGVREFEPGGAESSTQFDEGSEAVEGIALDTSGDLYISEGKAHYWEPCLCRFAEFGPSGKQLSSFGSRTLSYLTSSMAFSDAQAKLYVYGQSIASPEEPAQLGVWAFPKPAPGPLLEPGSEMATPELRGAATLQAVVNPEGSETTIHFEYVDEAGFRAGGYAGAMSTPPTTLAASFEDQLATAHPTLVPGTTYHWRVVATNAQGTVSGPDQSFEEIPPMRVDGPWASDLSATAVTLSARIDPLGASTDYRLEYGSSTSYEHAFIGNVGAGTGYVLVSFHLTDLQPGADYHYRLVTSNEVGTVEGPDHIFTMQLAQAELPLPDGRAWELVSPTDKKGGVIGLFFNNVIQAAQDGSGITYPTEGPAIGEEPQSRSIESTVLSRRGSAGWSSLDIDMPRRTVNEGESTQSLAGGGMGEFPVFSPDLTLAAAEPSGNATPSSPRKPPNARSISETTPGAPTSHS